METEAHKYLTTIGSKFIASFYDKSEIKRFLNCETIGNNYYVVFEEYTDDMDFGYTIRPATFIDIDVNYNTSNKEFLFKYKDAVFPKILDEDYLPTFANRITEGNCKYYLYSYN